MKSAMKSPKASSKMTVTIRVRPLSSKEMANGHLAIAEASERSQICSISKLERSGAVLQSEKGQLHSYEFDRVFGPSTTNAQVYESSVRNLIPHVLEGVNCTIFAYGATGAGKTHTIMGHEGDPGMMKRSMIDLFHAIECNPEAHAYSVRVSYMEVYCETIRDLLSDSDKPLNPCEHGAEGTVSVIGLTEREVMNVDQVLELVQEGSMRRKTEPTAANEVSSRSHAVLQVTVGKDVPNPRFKPAPPRVNGKQSTRLMQQEDQFLRQTVRFTLIDLAGSERAAETQNKGMRLREGANINKSLLALANCINALTSQGNNRVKYRDSKLTHLLKSSLEGDCRVVMLAAINPSHKSYEESHNTLKYAYRAKSIKSNPNNTTVLLSQQQHPQHHARIRQEEQEEDDDQEENENASRVVFQNSSPPPQHLSKKMKPVSTPSPPSFHVERTPSPVQESTEEQRDRLVEENLELKLELSKAVELISLLQRKKPAIPAFARTMSRDRQSTAANTRPSVTAAAVVRASPPVPVRPPSSRLHSAVKTATTTTPGNPSRVLSARTMIVPPVPLVRLGESPVVPARPAPSLNSRPPFRTSLANPSPRPTSAVRIRPSSATMSSQL